MFEQLIQGPADEPVTVANQAAWSRFDAPDQLVGSPPAENPEYDLVVSQIKTAREDIERLTRYCLMTQQWKLTLPGFPYRRPGFCVPVVFWPYGQLAENAIELMRHPVQAVQSITYLDPGGVEQTLDPSVYDVANDSILLKVGQTWPWTAQRDDAVRILHTAGYDPMGSPPTELPERLKTAVKYLAGWYYENRIPVSTQPTQDVLRTLASLLKGFRSGYLPRVNDAGSGWGFGWFR